MPHNKPFVARTAAAAAIALSTLAALAATPPASAQTLAAQAFVSGLNKPIFMTFAQGDATRLYVAEQRGVVKLIKNGVVQASAFLDLDAAIPDATYTGLFGLAFHPNYAANGKFYLYHTTGTSTAATVWIKEYTRMAGDPDHADPASGKVIFTMPSTATTQQHHLGGTIVFGADGMLWLATGDGGTTGGETAGGQRSQSSTSLWGKLIRIDVNGDDFPADPNANYAIPPSNPYYGSLSVANEIFARGLRNPFRMSVDRATGKLWIGDVGLTTREEIDLINPAVNGGANLGWNCSEGSLCTTNANCTCGSSIMRPVYEYVYGSTNGQCITGGVRYNGCAIPALVGQYIFGDYQLSKLYSFSYDDATGAVTNFQNRTAQVASPVLSNPICFAEDSYGEIYIVEHTAGRIRKLVSVPLPVDANGNGIPDSCEPPVLGDLNHDGVVDGADLGILLGAWGGSGGASGADLNHDGTVDGADLGMLLGAWTV